MIMNIDQRILDHLKSICEDNVDFYNEFITRLSEHGDGVNYHLARFNDRVFGFCDNEKNIYISEDLISKSPSGVFLFFVLLHETMHLNHDWKHACSLEYDAFKEYIISIEQEANDFALAHLIALKSRGFTDSINDLVKLVAQINVAQNDQFDSSYGAVYNTIGADLDFDKHLGVLV